MRSIIKRQINHNSFPGDFYQIDTSKMFIGGMSAGAIAGLSTIWYKNQTKINQAFPSVGATIQDVLGSINIDYYYGEPTIDYVPNIKGIINMWGAILIPIAFDNNEAGFFANADLKPQISFAGKLYSLFFFNDGTNQWVTFSATPTYNSESNCLLSGEGPYTVDGDKMTPDLVNGSSLNMYKIDSILGIPTELYVDCQMKHGLDKDCGTCNFQSDFGTGLTNSTDVGRYIAQRGAIFFQAVMNGIAGNLNRHVFIECENKRVKCSTTDNPVSCDTPTCDLTSN